MADQADGEQEPSHYVEITQHFSVPLYKYMSSSAALRFFESRMVRFTQPAEFNDPFELRPHIAGLADEESISRQHAVAFEPRSIESQLASAVSKLQLSPLEARTLDMQELVKAIQANQNNAFTFVKTISDALGPLLAKQMSSFFNENLGIFCLTEDPLNLLMWAHYADEHRGCVIEFDETHPFFQRRKGPNDDLRHFRNVTYAKIRPSIFLSKSDAVQVFYCKSTDWAYEREWRLVAPLRDATKRVDNVRGYPIYLFEVPATAVRGIIFGCRTLRAVHLLISSAVRRWSDYAHVEFACADVNDCQFALHRRLVSTDEVDTWLAQHTSTAPNPEG